jgi:hypothetical protein
MTNQVIGLTNQVIGLTNQVIVRTTNHLIGCTVFGGFSQGIGRASQVIGFKSAKKAVDSSVRAQRGGVGKYLLRVI